MNGTSGRVSACISLNDSVVTQTELYPTTKSISCCPESRRCPGWGRWGGKREGVSPEEALPPCHFWPEGTPPSLGPSSVSWPGPPHSELKRWAKTELGKKDWPWGRRATATPRTSVSLQKSEPKTLKARGCGALSGCAVLTVLFYGFLHSLSHSQDAIGEGMR